MIAHYEYQLALRTKLLSLSVTTTGTLSLAASTSGYSRPSGSFVSDGFKVGMEVSATGFTQTVNNDPKAITAVTALELTCAGCVSEAGAAGRVLSVGLPALRAWENAPLQPVSGRPYIVEEYLPGPVGALSLGPYATLDLQPTYLVTFYGPSNAGLAAVARYVDTCLTLFAPGTAITAGNGDILRVRSEVGPFRGQLSAADGWASIPVNIPLRVRTTNSI